MNISISRDGTEMGEWPEDQVLSMYKEGQLLPTDHYWKEGMADWAELSRMIKPPPPRALKPAIPGLPVRTEPWYRILKQYGIGRLAFLSWFVINNLVIYLLSLFAAFIGVSYALDTSTLESIRYCIIAAACLANGAVFLLRLINIGYKESVVFWRTLFAFVPALGLIILFICLFKPPGSAPASERN